MTLNDDSHVLNTQQGLLRVLSTHTILDNSLSTITVGWMATIPFIGARSLLKVHAKHPFIDASLFHNSMYATSTSMEGALPRWISKSTTAVGYQAIVLDIDFHALHSSKILNGLHELLSTPALQQ
ncbi:predicted protein [Lichtheimia corymbifera JMRC:FSU:9682]|uniref:Uncharacterized protein n=1 Tax=Lichtheimia corymbifera JMRC:FSU:9682 TaxID=1263082 RepID=A0A068SAB9_9FUNG|nr:predicted protein [Lichtheimia corymbifera JMRC:FSU:9682]